MPHMLSHQFGFLLCFSSPMPTQHMGSKESVAAKIDADTHVKIDEMNRSISSNRPQLIQELLDLVYDIQPALHRNYALQLKD